MAVPPSRTNGVHPPAAPTPLTLPVLSHVGQRALLVAADPSNAMTLDPAVASLLAHTAQDTALLRAVLEQLADALATGDVAAASAHLQRVLVPAHQVDAAQERFAAAYETVQAALAALEAANPDTTRLSAALPDPVLLRQLHTVAGEAAAAFDELALCAGAWADILAPGDAEST